MKNKFISRLWPAAWAVLALLGGISCSKKVRAPEASSGVAHQASLLQQYFQDQSTQVQTLLAGKRKKARALPLLEKGVSRPLADYRKKVIRNLEYGLHFTIPAQKSSPILGSETIFFTLTNKNHPLQLDFKEEGSKIQRVEVNTRRIAIDHRQEHLVIPGRYLKKGQNLIDIRFVAGDLSLNRNEDYLYTLLVPDRARTVFPVFDQPNLKASFTLTLTLPRQWKALANAPVEDSVLKAETKTYYFAPSDTIPSYLFSFAAGNFQALSRKQQDRTMHLLHRETDPKKLHYSLDTIFHLHNQALDFMKTYTGIPYPFRKLDLVAIPDFQYGGMEHVGAINYKASTLFLDEGSTLNQRIARSTLISHETAHMWFGNLVTMQWFDDVWMKEVFANFMADKITQQTLPQAGFDLKFLIDHYPAAYNVDRTSGANPIRQPLDNLQDAGSMYGNIIYHKAPIMMRQLEKLMGPKPFQQGLQDYLRRFSYANASWPDLIRILDIRTPADLQAWNRVWVNSPGRPVFDYKLETKEGRISRLEISQQAEDGSDHIWPQHFELRLVYPQGSKTLQVNMNQRQVVLDSAAGQPAPSYILFNSSGLGYGVFPADKGLTTGLFHLPQALNRASAYINLYENMLSGRGISPRQLLDTYRRGLTREPEELNLKLLTGQLSELYWKFLSPQTRLELAPALEKEIWDALMTNPSPNARKILLKTYQNIALTKIAQYSLYRIWATQQVPVGIRYTEDDYTDLALALALRGYAPENNILQKQLARISNTDRQKRLQFLMPALSPDVRQRDAFFASLKEARNREKEAWVVLALAYLHHPLRSATSEKYLAESLNLLGEVQLTGDIFFPQSWLQSTLGSYQSSTAAKTVQAFLQANPGYNPKLKAKILQAADDLFRAQKLVQHSE